MKSLPARAQFSLPKIRQTSAPTTAAQSIRRSKPLYPDSDAKKAVSKRLDLAPNSVPITWFEWLGLFSNEKVSLESGTAMDFLVSKLEAKLGYEPGERDMIVLYHEFICRISGEERKDNLNADRFWCSEWRFLDVTDGKPAGGRRHAPYSGG